MNNETLYKWELIPAGYDYAACDEKGIWAYSVPVFFGSISWTMADFGECKSLPLSVLNRLPGEPSTTLEKRPGVRND